MLLLSSSSLQCARELVCLVQFDFVDLYTGLQWRKKYHAPTDFTFALKVDFIIFAFKVEL